MNGIDIIQTEFQYYPAKIYLTEPLGVITLEQLLLSIKDPGSKLRKVFKQIRKATEDGDRELKDKLKQEHLYSFTPSVLCNGEGRKLDYIIKYNPIMIVEFDKIDFAEELKYVLFDNLKCVIAAFMSPSKKGVKFIINIPEPSSLEEYKEYYSGIAYYLENIKGFDPANYNAILPMFVSWDPDILIREDSEPWTIKGEKINSFKPVSESDIKKLPKARNSIANKKRLLDRICRMFDKIIDNGHTQVVCNCSVIGGFVGAGRLDYTEAWSQIESCIRQNNYLSKGTKGYLKTAKQMFDKGINSPLYED